MKNAPYIGLIVAICGAILVCIVAIALLLRMMNTPPCDDSAIRTEYDARHARTLEVLRGYMVADSLKAIEIDSLNALLDRPVRPLQQVLDDHRRAAQDASLDTVMRGLLKGVE